MAKVVDVHNIALKAEGYADFEHWNSFPSNIYIGDKNSTVGTFTSKWNNPYPVKKHGIKDSLKLYESYLHSNGLVYSIHELIGKNLGCWCSNTEKCSYDGVVETCHGQVLLRKIRDYDGYIQVQCMKILNSFALFPIANHKISGSDHKYGVYFIHKKKKYLLEYDDKSHFKYLDYIHKNIDEFGKQKISDIKNTHFALENGYNVIRIDYTKIREIECQIVEALTSKERLYLATPKLYEYITESFTTKEAIVAKKENLVNAIVETGLSW